MSDFLESLNPDLREAVELVGECINFEAGQTVFSRGDPGSSFYVIRNGTARVHDGDLVLNELGAGDVFGEIAGLRWQQEQPNQLYWTPLAGDRYGWGLHPMTGDWAALRCRE